MADWSKPALASTYVNFVTEVSSRDTDVAVGFDPAVVTPTNIPTNTIRWRAAASKWEKWNGTAWGDLATAYAINISGTAANVTGVCLPINGGTGTNGYTTGDMLFASAPTTLEKLAAVATGNVLLSGGAATAPSWGKVDLTSHVKGILPLANGGTGGTSGVFASGTRMPFAQPSAPTGWTQDVSDNAKNRMLRVVNTVGNSVGGSHSPILNNVVPAHTHGMTTGTVSSDHSHSGYSGTQSANHVHGIRSLSGSNWVGTNGYTVGYGQGDAGWPTDKVGANSDSHYHSITTGGISANHTHSGTTDNGSSQTNWQPRYIDLIICSKD